MSSGPKQQHFLPKVYLKPWCYQRKKSLICYVSSKEEIEWHPHDTGSIMKENEIYTIFSEDGVCHVAVKGDIGPVHANFCT
jgi:hypothetical protein